MRKTALYLMMFFSVLATTPLYAGESNAPRIEVSGEPKEVPAEVQVKLDRLEEIRAMDKSNMSRAEKKALRKEVKAIKAELRSTGNGVYLSVGAIIIIILLLILLL